MESAVVIVPCDHGYIDMHLYRCGCPKGEHQYLGCPLLRCNGGTRIPIDEIESVPVCRNCGGGLDDEVCDSPDFGGRRVWVEGS